MKGQSLFCVCVCLGEGGWGGGGGGIRKKILQNVKFLSRELNDKQAAS